MKQAPKQNNPSEVQTAQTQPCADDDATFSLLTRTDILFAMLELLAQWRTRVAVLASSVESLTTAVQAAVQHTRIEVEEGVEADPLHLCIVEVLSRGERVNTIAANATVPPLQRSYVKRLMVLSSELRRHMETTTQP